MVQPNKGGNNLEANKAKLAELKKQDGDLRDKIQTLEDSIKAEGGNEVKTTKVGIARNCAAIISSTMWKFRLLCMPRIILM